MDRGMNNHRPLALSAAARLSALAAASALLGGCFSPPPAVNTVPVITRLDVVPTSAPGLHRPVDIYWDEHQIPFIDAKDDRDVPFAIGMVHAHLRMGQMEMFRRIAQGRLAESAGPLGPVVELDHALRAIDFPKAAAEIESTLRPDTKAWLARYVEGVNFYRSRAPAPPIEATVLAIENEPWTIRDVIVTGRLAAIDITWGAFYSYLNLHKEKGFDDFWKRSLEFAGEATPSFGGEGPIRELAGIGKTGSNCFAIAGSKTASGKPILASDPHVGFNLPSLWCYIGYQSPSYHVSGLTIGGLPFVMLGRNQEIAWGGTNMQGISSSLIDVSHVAPSQISERKVTIRRRWWFEAKRAIRETPYGPIVTELGPMAGKSDRPLALWWRGHTASDEFSPLLDVSTARTWDDFRRAFAPWAVSGQNFLYADRSGNIGQLAAFEFHPGAGLAARNPVADPSNPAHDRERAIGGFDLPTAYNPPSGVLISTNNTPAKTDPPMVLAGNANDRHDRIATLIAEAQAETRDKMDSARAAAIQRDVYSASSHDLAKAIVEHAEKLSVASPLLWDLKAWDGRYETSSRGALVLQVVAFRLTELGYKDRYSPKVVEALRGSASMASLVADDVRSGSLDHALPQAFVDAKADAGVELTWGDIHKLKVAHWIGSAPLIGGPYRYAEFAVPGSTTTIFKTAHPVTSGKHAATYGANARHIVDLSDPDSTQFVMLGGQDGWVGSANFMDMVAPWREGSLIRVPMTLERVKAWAARVTTVTP